MSFIKTLVPVAALLVAATASTSVLATDNNWGHDNRPVTVYFTRHAEKQTVLKDLGDGNFMEDCGTSKCNEELNAKGEERAELLADWFFRRGVAYELDAVYATHKQRTQQTVAPTADVADLPVIVLGGESDLSPESTTPSECPTIEAILSTPPGDTILVAGHSGTLYDIMGDGNDDCTGLGLLTDSDPSSHRFPKRDDGKVRDFGDIWKVSIRNGVAKFRYRVNLDFTRLNVVDRAR